jgi:two-component system chemotaxis response regulator CheY
MLPRPESQHVEHLRVLVVDPDGDTRSLYRQTLELAGHDIIEAADGRDALVKALETLPQFVVTETRLPMMDGYALCEILRQDRLTHRVPILVVTSEARTEKLARARAVGANAVLVKPVEIDAILDHMKRLIENGGGNGNGASALPIAAAPRPVDLEEETGARTRMTLSKTHQRFDTTTPPANPPAASAAVIPSSGITTCVPAPVARSNTGSARAKYVASPIRPPRRCASAPRSRTFDSLAFAIQHRSSARLSAERPSRRRSPERLALHRCAARPV